MVDSLHYGHGVFKAASVLGSLGHTHGSLEKDLDCGLGHVVVDIEFTIVLFAHLLDDGT